MALFGNARLRADMMGDYPPGAVPFYPTPDDRAAALVMAGQRTPSPIQIERPDIMWNSPDPRQEGTFAPTPMSPPGQGSLPALRGMFGNAMATDPQSSLSAVVPGGGASPTAIAPSDPTALQAPGTNLTAGLDLASAKVKHPGFFQHGGVGEKILHGLGEFALRYSASQGDPAALMTLRNRIEEKQRLQDRQWAVEDRDARLYAPQYFNSGRDRVLYDPRSGKSNVVYDGPEDYQQYADTLGLQPGDEGYDDAVRDYVLRSSGPTAYANRTALEGVRQGNRVSLEGIRQGNRAALRSMPNYANLHPRVSGGGGRGGGGGSHRTGYADVYAPILEKVARGQPLTPGEQQALAMRGRRGGGIPNGQGQFVSPGGGPPRVPGTKENPAFVAQAAEVQHLPSGTWYRTPDGRVMQRK